jgi:hypothetical protein
MVLFEPHCSNDIRSSLVGSFESRFWGENVGISIASGEASKSGSLREREKCNDICYSSFAPRTDAAPTGRTGPLRADHHAEVVEARSESFVLNQN